MKINLTNKTALVCGSTGGIGKAIAQQFAESGANVILLARNESKLEAVLDTLATEEGQWHRYYIADFQNNDDVRNVIADILTKNTVDILVNNTGGPPAGTAIDASADEYVTAFNLHLVNNQILANAVAEGMKKNGFGRIINVISTSVKIPLKGLGVSNTVRGAVGNWSKTIANELAPFGITVNNILPGATETERLSSIITNKAGKTSSSEEEVQKAMLAQIPAARFARPEEPAFAATFLASNKAAYITGTNVVVDGGRTGSL
jgi:3-oxoacyl-[acyl-carrier protein] reductase